MVGYIAQEHVHHPPVQKLLVVPVSPDEAFRRFAAIGKWWPLATHAVAMGEALSAEIEGHVGGRVLERGRDGSERVWGTVTQWTAPNRLSMSWHPGRAPETAQDLAVVFSAVNGGTEIQLTHSGWERLAKRAGEVRSMYVSAWRYVLARFWSAG